MNTNRVLLIFLLIICLISSGLEHKILYFLFTLLGFLALYNNKFVIKINYTSKRLYIIIGIFFMILLVHILFYYNGIFEIVGFIRYLTYLFLFFFVQSLSNRTIHLFFKLSTLIILLSIPYGCYISILQNQRYTFIFTHANHLAYVSILYTFYYIKIAKLKSNYIKWLIILCFGIIIFLSKSTGGSLSYSILILYSIIDSRAKSNIFDTFLKLAPVLLLLFGIFIISDRFQEQLQYLEYFNYTYIMNQVDLKISGGLGSGIWRIVYWLSILSDFFNESIMKIFFGLGIDTMSAGHYHYEFMFTDPHNDFIRLIVEVGVIGSTFFFYHFYKIISVFNYRNYLIIITCFPMLFGNIIIDFSYVFVFIILLTISNNNFQCAI